MGEDVAQRLVVEDLASRHPGVTKAIGDSYAEAAAVCLSRHHAPPASMIVDRGDAFVPCAAYWSPPDHRVSQAWANEIDATELGAYAVSLATVEVSEGLVAVRRAETLTGADYYIAPVGADPEDLERWLRLEVSGTDKGDRREIKVRLHRKVTQASKGASNLPALAAVVGFRELVVAIARVDELW
jgi:hypothetical protein